MSHENAAFAIIYIFSLHLLMLVYVIYIKVNISVESSVIVYFVTISAFFESLKTIRNLGIETTKWKYFKIKFWSRFMKIWHLNDLKAKRMCRKSEFMHITSLLFLIQVSSYVQVIVSLLVWSWLWPWSELVSDVIWPLWIMAIYRRISLQWELILLMVLVSLEAIVWAEIIFRFSRSFPPVDF